MSEELTKLEESAMQSTIKLTIENKRLRAHINELEEKLNNEWTKVSAYKKIPENIALLVKINDRPHVAKLKTFTWHLQCMHSNHQFECDLLMADEWRYITPPTQEGDKE